MLRCRLLHMMLWFGLVIGSVTTGAGAQAVPAAAKPATPVNVLDQQTINLNFNNMPLEGAFKTVADLTGARMSVRWSAIEAAGIARNTPITLVVKNVRGLAALEILCMLVSGNQVHLSTKIGADGIAHVSTAEDNNRETDVVVRFYNIQSLIDATVRLRRAQALNARDAPTVQDAIDQLTNSIESSIKTETWKDNGGAAGSLRVFANTLIVSTTPEIQDQVDAMLKRLGNELGVSTPSAR